ncbi:protein kinase [Singulisphaera sp. Ch08]|uniref:Protein kinase n=1 Tax=Singulisphaera sp. Ch08 TaxID=3120278 RepID=A0AAU7CQ68_9BACT
MSIDGNIGESAGDDKLGEDDSILARWAAELADRIQAGEVPNLEEYIREHPEKADQLRRLLPTIAMMADLRTSVDQVFAPGFDLGVGQGILGEFHLLREIGRGGMGVVYEALEVPLGRRVALKVLPIAAALDPRQLKRFQLEAQAVASLNHRNIVPIFSVGRDRGVSYFAMQLIEGRTLADVNRELRQFDERGTVKETVVVSDVTRSLLESLPFPGGREEVVADATACESEVAPPRTERTSSSPSLPPTRGRAFFRTAAGLGRQAAEALAHVHDLGIQHRDIKPANLLVDARGHLWVTDFGLARLQGDCEQTRTGDLVGTLRYMSPEQALARPGLIDHRTDIYSLGATLYELLTLRPAFGGDDRQDLLLRIIQETPVPSRRLNPAIPIDLETIVSKAMANEPSRRYATAQELAEDLTRFLEGRPVLARRPSPVDGASKWVRRRWPFVAMAATLMLMFVGASIAGLSWSNARLRIYIDRLQKEVARADRNARAANQQQQFAQERQEFADRHLDNAQIRLAEQALDQGQMERTQEILNDVKAGPDGINPRNFAWHYLQRQATREIVLLRGHDDVVDFMTISPDGRALATVDSAGKMLLWNTESGQLRKSLQGKNPLRSGNPPKFSPDNRYLLTVESDQDELDRKLPSPNRDLGPAVVIWDVITGLCRSRTVFDPKPGRLAGAGFVAGGEAFYILWAEPDATLSVSIWTLGPGRSPPQPRCEVRQLSQACFSPRGRIFGVLQFGQLQLRDVNSGLIRRVLTDFENPGFVGGLSADGQLLAISNSIQGARIFETESGVELERDRTKEFTFFPEFDAKSQIMAAQGKPRVEPIYLWERTNNQWDILELKEINDAYDPDFSISADGSWLALATRDAGRVKGPVTLWDVSSKRLLKTFTGRTGIYQTPIFSPDGRSLYLACSTDICRWFPDQADEETPRSLAGHSDEAWAVTFSPDSRILASGSDDTDEPQRIKLWDMATGRKLRGWEGHQGLVSALAFSPDGHALASVALCSENNVKVWDSASGRLRTTLVGHTKGVRTVAYSPDGSLLATAGSDREIRLWDSATGRLRSLFSGHTQSVYQVAFSPDGQSLASASNDRTFRTWDVAAGVQRSVFKGTSNFMAIAFSPDGSMLATADQSGRIILFDLATGAISGRIHCDDGTLLGLTFSPDGAIIAAAGVSRVIHIWDVVTRQELMTLSGHGHQINDLAFSPDGMMLASCSHDGAVKIWDARPRSMNRHDDGEKSVWTGESSQVDFAVPSTYFQKEE